MNGRKIGELHDQWIEQRIKEMEASGLLRVMAEHRVSTKQADERQERIRAEYKPLRKDVRNALLAEIGLGPESAFEWELQRGREALDEIAKHTIRRKAGWEARVTKQ